MPPTPLPHPRFLLAVLVYWSISVCTSYYYINCKCGGKGSGYGGGGGLNSYHYNSSTAVFTISPDHTDCHDLSSNGSRGNSLSVRVREGMERIWAFPSAGMGTIVN